MTAHDNEIEAYTPVVDHEIPAPPPRISRSKYTNQKWNELFAPYPWIWCDAIAYSYAVAYIDGLLVTDRAIDELSNDDLINMNDQGNYSANPLAGIGRAFSGQMLRALALFEERILTLAPKYKRGDDVQAWRHIPHVGRGKNHIDSIEEGTVDVTPKNNRLLLGGRSVN